MTLKRIEQLQIARHILIWGTISIPIALSVGSSVALFLWLLENATHLHQNHRWLLFLLPIAGFVIYSLYSRFGKNSDAGNNLIMDEIHKPGAGVTIRMAPLVLATTVITHFFGGSAGREGTAVQIGGSISSLIGKWMNLSSEDTKTILTMGVAAGFGAVFGTPLTGAIFALEVLSLGRIKYNALLPCLITSILADIVCTAWGIGHTKYHISFEAVAENTSLLIHFNLLLLLKTILGGTCFGLASYMFSELSHTIKEYSKKKIKKAWLIPVIGGSIIIGLRYATGTPDYLGLGVTSPNADGVSIVNAFNEGGSHTFSWFWKLVFTTVTLGMGFKGGEVTPLFFIGATLGNTIGTLLGAPVDLMAGIGFIAVFAGATNTPIACTIMGIELFGGEHVIYYAAGCFVAYYFSGHSGIYTSQRIAVSKTNAKYESTTLKEIRKKKQQS